MRCYIESLCRRIGSISPLVTAGFVIVYALVLLYLVTLFIGSHRTVYDRLAGSIVIQR